MPLQPVPGPALAPAGTDVGASAGAIPAPDRPADRRRDVGTPRLRRPDLGLLARALLPLLAQLQGDPDALVKDLLQPCGRERVREHGAYRLEIGLERAA